VERGRDAGEFVSRTEAVHGGLDFYVSTNGLGMRLAKDVADAFGGTIAASPKLFGQREGKEIYRVTTLVRLPAFQVGDVVRHKGSVTEVVGLRPFVELRDLVTGEKRRFKTKDLRGLRRIEAERFEADVRDGGAGALLVVHPESGAERPIRTRGAQAGRCAVVWTADDAYASALPALPSKP
jgi:nonsense-mediated mRNA decay protein 3